MRQTGPLHSPVEVIHFDDLNVGDSELNESGGSFEEDGFWYVLAMVGYTSVTSRGSGPPYLGQQSRWCVTLA